MEEWKIKLIEEYNTLKERMENLRKYINTESYETINNEDKKDLRRQLMFMRQYLMCLRRRMERNDLFNI